MITKEICFEPHIRMLQAASKGDRSADILLKMLSFSVFL